VSEYDELLKNPIRLKKYIMESLRIKKKVIEIDEFDRNERNLFNYGHTFGHAIETVTAYDISHGQAVTMGMDIANYISLSLCYLSEEDFAYMHNVLIKNIPSFRLQDDMLGEYLNALSKDKKNVGNQLGCILSSGLGAMKKVFIQLDDELKSLIRSYFKIHSKIDLEY
jgi:3-dehydroquinate synthase